MSKLPHLMGALNILPNIRSALGRAARLHEGLEEFGVRTAPTLSKAAV
jgi:hypothetical protein